MSDFDRTFTTHYPDVHEGDVVTIEYAYNYDGDRTARTGEVIERGDHSIRIDAGDEEKATKLAIRANAARDGVWARVTSALKPDDDYRHYRHLSELNIRAYRSVDDVEVTVESRGGA
jgi:hypothetical protein